MSYTNTNPDEYEAAQALIMLSNAYQHQKKCIISLQNQRSKERKNKQVAEEIRLLKKLRDDDSSLISQIQQILPCCGVDKFHQLPYTHGSELRSVRKDLSRRRTHRCEESDLNEKTIRVKQLNGYAQSRYHQRLKVNAKNRQREIAFLYEQNGKLKADLKIIHEMLRAGRVIIVVCSQRSTT